MGTWGEWVGGLLGALIAGAVPFVLYRLERKDRKEAQQLADFLQMQAAEHALTEQVRAVAAWAGPVLDDPEAPSVFVVQNSSSLPVFQARAGWVLPESDEDKPRVHAENTWDVLQPGRSYAGNDYLPDGVVWCLITFRDASGNWWARTSTGSYAETNPGLAADLQALANQQLDPYNGSLSRLPPELQSTPEELSGL